MALTSVLTCCAIISLLVSVTLCATLELSQPLHRVERAVLSENPTEEFNGLISEQLSRTNVQSLLKNIVPNKVQDIRSRLANEDLLREFLRSYVENPNFKSSLLQAADNDNVQSVIDLLNSEFGGTVLALSNSSVVVNVDAIETILIAYSKKYIQEIYSDDFLRQIVVTGVVNEQIKLAAAQLRLYLADKVIPVKCINAIISLARESHRSKRDLNSLILDLALGLLRPQLAAILTPIQDQINAVLNNVTTVILSFYTITEPTSPLLDIIANFINVLVLRVAEVVVVLQTNVNAVFSNLINGTSTSTSRRRRDIDLEFDNVYDFDIIDLAVSHKRVTRSLDLVQGIGGLISGLTQSVVGLGTGLLSILAASLNSLLKNIFINILTPQYQSIGELVTTPLRAVVEWLIDTLLPCSTCVSIVYSV